MLKVKEVVLKKGKSKITVGLLTVVLTALLIFCLVQIGGLFFPEFFYNGFVPSSYGRRVSENVKIAQGLQMPDWVDSQIIKIHSTARTGGHLRDIKNIVVHYVGNPNSTAQNNRDYFDKLTTKVSSHFIVGLEGEVIQCIPLWEKSAASNDRNIDTVSIEVCHPDENGEFNELTYNSLVKLSAWLCEKFSLDEKDIIRHYDITGKQCPKYYVEHPEKWELFKREVRKELKSYEEV